MAPAPDPHAPEPKIGHPERFDGDPDKVDPFLTACRVQFNLQPRTFSTEPVKVGFVINHLTGRAMLWGAAEFDRQTPACNSFTTFAAELRKVFGTGLSSEDASVALMSIRQGSRTVADYSIDFRTKARRSPWNDQALVDAFLHGLADYVKDGLLPFDRPSTLDDAVALAVKFDHRFQSRRRERGRPKLLTTSSSGSSPSTSVPTGSRSNQSEPEPMEVGRASLPPEERQRRLTGNLCLYCGGEGHRAATCPLKGRAHRI